MGQKNSSEGSSDLTLTKENSEELKKKTQNITQCLNEKIVQNVPQKLRNNFADAKNKPPDLPRAQKDDDDDVECPVRCLPKDGLNTDCLAFVVNPSIAEFSQMAALRMMQNFEGCAVAEDMMLRDQVHEMNEKHLDNDASEKDFRTIMYEDLPTLQLVENTTEVLKCDIATYTSESKELITDDFKRAISSQENLPCKEDPTSASSSSDSSDSPKRQDDVSSTDSSDEAATLRNDSSDNDESEGRTKKIVVGDYELLQLRERLGRLECERDEARVRLRAAEEKCEAYEKESRCLEATLGTMEEKLRSIVTELSGELKKSKDLEQQLSEAFRNASGDTALTPSNP